MANKWGIPADVEQHVLNRDKCCVYCGIEFKPNITERKFKQSWEHIVNDIRINGSDNIALCCVSCNASKGAKELEDWLNSKYCITKNITPQSVSQVVKDALIKKPSL
jgi:hypothetical protein